MLWETIQIINGGAFFRWSFDPLSAWGSIESTTILTTHVSLFSLWNQFFSLFRIWYQKMQHVISLATPSITLGGQMTTVVRRVTEYTLLPEVVIFLVDHERSRVVMTKKIRDYIQNAQPKELRRLCTVNYGAMTVWVSFLHHQPLTSHHFYFFSKK